MANGAGCYNRRAVPLQNRVTPLGDLVAHPARGLVYGNRGCLHDAEGGIRRHYGVRRWISCRLRYKDWHRGPLLQPGKFTELFFLDEATALAAGHRPCALCRREDYDWFVARWTRLHPSDVGADAIDLRLHAERFDTGKRARRLHPADSGGLPDGAMVLRDGGPYLVLESSLRHWSPAGYGERVSRPSSGRMVSITPPSLLAILADGWESALPLLHPSATA
jgi:hypothetical protein